MRAHRGRWIGPALFAVAGFVACAPNIGPDLQGYPDASHHGDASVTDASHDASPTDASPPRDATADSMAPPDSGQVADSGIDESTGRDAVADATGHDSSRDAHRDVGVATDGPTCSGLLGPAVQVPTPLGGSWIIATDLDNDGNNDLALTASGLQVLLGHGDGTFAAVAGYNIGVDGICLVAGDLDSDGSKDIVVANRGNSGSDTGAVEVLLGHGDGTFRAPVSVKGVDCPYGVAIADFNGDGKPDIAASGEGSGCYGYGNGGIYVLLGNGDGTFQAPAFLTSGSTPSQLAAADLDGDGRMDIIAADNTGLMVLLGHGDGTFKGPALYGSPGVSVVIADLNLDGIPDLAGQYFVGLGKGDGTFTSVPASNVGGFMDWGDIDNDGNPDLVNIAGVLLGRGDGSFQSPAAFAVGASPFSTAVKDFNNDGVADVAVANFGSAYVSVLLSCR